MLDFSEPSRSGCLRAPGRRWRAGPGPRSGRRGRCRCRGPRPRRRRTGSRPALARAWRITRSWEGPLGAVRPLEAPSWLTAEPRIVARTRWPFALGVGEALEHEHADALGRSRCRRPPSAKDLQRPSGARPRWRLRLDEDARRRQHRHPAGQSQRALAAAQRLRSQVHRHQRGGAGGVDGDRRPLEAEGVGDAAGDDAAGDAGAQSPRARVRRRAADRSRGTSPRRRRRCGCPAAAPGSTPASSSASQAASKQQPLLGVHRQRLARADAEEARRRSRRRRRGSRLRARSSCPGLSGSGS